MLPGEQKDYYYPNAQDARTLWYHDHAMGLTTVNAYAGLAGFYMIDDERENARVKLPTGAYDIPLMFQSRFYTANGNITDESAELTSTYGDTYSVNGQILPHLVVEPRKYRFRMLNAAASRTFNFTLEAASRRAPRLPMYVVGADAGLLTHPVKTESLVLTMAERWEVVIDFSDYAGQNIMLKSATTFADEEYIGTGNVMQFRVGKKVTSKECNSALPAILSDHGKNLIDTGKPTDKIYRFGRVFPYVHSRPK